LRRADAVVEFEEFVIGDLKLLRAELERILLERELSEGHNQLICCAVS
jgi:hypothetical protein